MRPRVSSRACKPRWQAAALSRAVRTGESSFLRNRLHTARQIAVRRQRTCRPPPHVVAGDPAFAFYSPELLASQEEFLRARQSLQELPPDARSETRHAAEDLFAAARRRLELYDVPQSFIARIERTGKSERTVTILAGASGWVTMKNVIEGQQVEPGAELFTITDLSRVWMRPILLNEAQLVGSVMPRL